ncbi:transposase, partial [Dysosmobacter sp. HCP28S3_G4]|uniref:transposase n=1 Tax=Dysosmobacter sp. HCP28S3_G4 TaxID=3438938 RepID=UPI003F897A76
SAALGTALIMRGWRVFSPRSKRRRSIRSRLTSCRENRDHPKFCVNLRCGASILHHIGGLHKIWDGLSWRDNWPNLSTYFKYPQEVRRLIYTTNTIEGFNRQLRKVTKAKSVFPTDDSLLKMLYLAMIDITKKWTGRRQDWSMIHAQLAVFFADRMPE